MKTIMGMLLFILLNCGTQTTQKTDSPVESIKFEEVNHYAYSLTSKPFLVVDTQQKMDEVFRIIHSKISGNRLPPIITLYPEEEETYLIFKPVLTLSNDVQITAMNYDRGVLSIHIKPVYNPEFPQESRVQPSIMVKILKKIKITNVKIVNHS